eukprot:CAMPEP_0203873610 /NCGR_PEP_ID=MMETSP0359-20131031/19838_1 /ASSEMBLY_ACC=CAM_ASM_000338 /TAXON_ID=268821 /ORGANISM="Scrippsiella Hangoei, Strain SHTV-5" /LENGTH=385 /DNA_ID=CAMNT_0050792311 /DNA_START=3 /DNA_END=1160 /DNA_ORIENTATION=-
MATAVLTQRLAEWRRVFSQAAGPLSASWQRTPTVFMHGEALVKGRLTLADVAPLVDSGQMPAGCAALSGGSYASRGGSWTSAPLKGPLAEVLPAATVYANNAGMYMPALAELCIAGVETFGWPITCNAYLSAPGLQVSVPPHTDRQDVLVLQTTGRKRWKVYAPPAVEKGLDPLRRGKDGDEFLWDVLGDPLLDVTLMPGDGLYVPLGFPHATTTAFEDASPEPSVHVTLNVDSLIWGLSYRLLWAAAVRQSRLAAGREDRAEEAGTAMNADGLGWQQYASLQAPLNFGFMETSSGDDALGEMTGDLRRRAEAWGAHDEISEEGVRAAMGMLRRHKDELLQLHRQMYMDVLLDLTDLSPMEKEMGHWQLLQEQMAKLRCDMGWEE